MTDRKPEFFDLGSEAAARQIAVRADAGKAPGVLWLGGFKSDMQGTKAQALADWAAQAGRSCVRFDYSGHGESGGAFADGTIGQWLEDSVAVFDRFCEGPQGVIGSVHGGLDGAAAGARTGAAGQLWPRQPGRPGADRPGAGFYRRSDVERVLGK